MLSYVRICFVFVESMKYPRNICAYNSPELRIHMRRVEEGSCKGRGVRVCGAEGRGGGACGGGRDGRGLKQGRWGRTEPQPRLADTGQENPETENKISFQHHLGFKIHIVSLYKYLPAVCATVLLLFSDRSF